MKQYSVGSRWYIVMLAMTFWLGACSGPREGDDTPGRRAPIQRDEPPSEIDVDLEAPVDIVKTVQLYAGEEDRLPIVTLRSNEKLTLEFDLMEGSGRPLSAYFYHADRSWRRDLFASEYLTSFDRDDLFDYTISRGTQVPYTHYKYTFPNRNIGFRISGNFIIRVTEQGREDEVLFERAFFVTEQAASLQFGIEQVLAGASAPLAQPVLSFTPPQALAGNVFDYNVCFVRNGRFENTRCSDRPSLSQQPDLLFFLQPQAAFEPQVGDYVLDLRALRAGGDIERVDRTTQPYEAMLAPDYARFPASGIEPLLNGQTVVSSVVRDVGDPDIEAEYVQTLFNYVPPKEQRLPGAVMLTGSFNGWAFDLGNELRWSAERRRYEGELLLKQGLYEYRYTSPNRSVQRELSATLARPENFYAAFVYFSDSSLNTDRLLAAQVVRSQ